MDPDDIIDVKAEVVDAGEDPKARKGANATPPRPGDARRGPRGSVDYEETVYTETSAGGPGRWPFGAPLGGGGFPEPAPTPWWLPLAAYGTVGLLGLLAVGCLVSGALGWIFSALGCIVFTNAIFGLVMGPDDDEDFRGRGPPGRSRSPWV
jgi:hypothetical protein